MKLVKFKHLEPYKLGIHRERFDVTKDGVNASLLSKWLACREQARLYLQGWTPKRISSGRVFGTISHGVLDVIYSDIQSGALDTIPSPKRVKKVIAGQEKLWRKLNPKADADTLQNLEMNCLLAEAILPVYFKFWHKDISSMDWHALEHKFRVEIPGTGTKLIGKMDGNFHPMKGKKVMWLFETKNKSRLGEQGETNLVDILPHELQVNLYLGAMVMMYDEIPGGLLMNIIRRPNFKGKKGESMEALAKRIADDVRKRPSYYFIRIRMTVDKNDLARMQREHAALTRDFVRWATGKGEHYRNSDHCENKYGTCDFLPICSRGDFSFFYQRPPRIRKEDETR